MSGLNATFPRRDFKAKPRKMAGAEAVLGGSRGLLAS
jgi:hypothetical protein